MNRLKFYRLERGLSQIELAQASGVPRYVIQLAEQEIRQLKQEEREKLAIALGIQEQVINSSLRLEK